MSECIKPLRNKVVVKPSPIKEKTDGGIYRSDTKEKPVEGVVTAIGSGILTLNGISVPLEVAVGDVVLYSKHVGVEVKSNNETFLILNEEDVLAIKTTV
jgi:chaperonin GroES